MENAIEIAGLDFAKGLEHVSGKKEDYFKILRSFITNTKTKLGLLENFDINDKDNLKQYEITVHGIKGASYLIYAQQIGDQAAALEKAAIKGDLNYINQHNSTLLKDTWKFINDLEDMFKKFDAEKTKPKKDKPDKETLAKLAAACDIYDMLEVEAAMEEINSYEYDSDDDLAVWLKKNVEEMNYEAIVKKLL